MRNNQNSIFAPGHSRLLWTPFLGSVWLRSALQCSDPVTTGRKPLALLSEFPQNSFWVTVCNLFFLTSYIPQKSHSNISYHLFRTNGGYFLLKLKTTSPGSMCCIFICEQRQEFLPGLFQGVWADTGLSICKNMES